MKQLFSLAFFSLIGLVFLPLAASSTSQANEPISTFNASEGGITSVAFSPNGQLLVLEGLYDSSEFELWEVSGATARSIANFPDRGVDWWVARLSPDGQRLVGWTDNGTIEVWDVSGKVKHDTTIYAYMFETEEMDLSFSADNRLLASSGQNYYDDYGEFKVWDLVRGVQRGTTIEDRNVNEGSIITLNFSPDNQLLASLNASGLIRLWDLSRGALISKIAAHEHSGEDNGLSFSADGRLLASAGSWWSGERPDVGEAGTEKETREVKLWDTSKGQLLSTFKAASPPVSFSPVGQILASASASTLEWTWHEDGTGSGQQSGGYNVKLWDVSTGNPIATLQASGILKVNNESPRALIFSPDGQRLASQFSNTVQLWDVSEWIPNARLTPDPSKVTFSADDPAWKTFTVHTNLDSVLVRANPSGSDLAIEVSGGQRAPTRNFCPAEGNDRPTSGRRDGWNLHVRVCQAGKTKILLLDYESGSVLQEYEIEVKAAAAGKLTTTRLNPNYPNPFNSETTLSYTLPTAADVRLEVFNLNGQRVAILHEGFQVAGYHTVALDASGLASGVYLYRLTTPEGRFVQKFTLLR